jgi:hypothetical protein
MKDFTDFLKVVVDVINAAAKSRLSMLSLLSLLITFLAFTFFNEEDSFIKVSIFIILFIGVALLGRAIMAPQKKISKDDTREVSKSRISVSEVLPVLGMLITIIVVTCYGLFWQTHSKHYKGYNRTRSGWTGLQPVSRACAKHQHAIYKFTYKGYLGDLQYVEYLNSSGGITDRNIPDLFVELLIRECAEGMRTMKVGFKYDQDDNLTQEVFYDQTNRQLVALDYERNSAVLELRYQKGSSCSKAKNAIRTARVAYIEGQENHGKVESIRFYDENAKVPIPDDEKYFGVSFEYNPDGTLKTSSYLDCKGMVTGIITRYKYSPERQLSEKTYWTTKGEKTYRYGVAKTLYKYDVHGNLSGESHYDEADNPTYGGMSVTTTRYYYDEKGNNTVKTYHGPDGKLQSSCESWAVELKEFDGRGLVKKISYLGEDSLPTVVSHNGFSTRTAVYDEYQRERTGQLFDEKGKRVYDMQGYSRKDFVYNERGFLTELQFKDTAGNLTNIAGGYALMKHSFNDFGFRDEIRVLDEKRNAAYVIPDGYSISRSIFNENGQRIEVAYFDTQLTPVRLRIGMQGYHKQVIKYNDLGLKEETRYLDPDGQLTRGYFAIERHKYDDRGRLTETTNYDHNDKPYTAGTFRIVYAYNELNQLIGQQTFNAGGTLRYLGKSCQVSFGYDKWGRLSKEYYLDSASKPSTNQYNITTVEYTRDRLGNITDKKFLQVSDKGIQSSSIERTVYDKKSYYVIEKSWYNESGNLKDRGDGIALVKYDNDRYGRVKHEAFYSSKRQAVADNDGVHRSEYEYDKIGALTKEAYFDIDGERAHRSGESMVVYENNKAGQPVKTWVYGPDGKPTGQYSFMKTEYDLTGLQIRRTFHADDDKLINNEFGIARIDEVRNSEGELIEKRYLDQDLRPVNSTHGFHKTVYQYKNNVKLEQRYDVRGQLVAEIVE